MDTIEALSAQVQALTQRVTALEQQTAVQHAAQTAQQPAPVLEVATADTLDALCRRHTGQALTALLATAECAPETVVGLPLVAARDLMFSVVVDHNHVVFATGASTRIARNGSPYLSVNFGFGVCAVFHNDVDRVFRDTGYLMLDWQRDGYSLEFNPPLSAILERDGRGYPRIVRLWQPDNTLDDTAAPDSAQEIPF